MRTGEIARLLEDALHEADDVPVDVARGRARLVRRLEGQHRAVRHWAVAAVAASVLAVAVVVVGALADREEQQPVRPAPGVTLSPSGLPVGVLEGRIERTEAGVVSDVRMVVRPDGTGTWNGGTVGASEGDSVSDYAVEFVRDRPGRAIMRNTDYWCFGDEVLRLDFTVAGRKVLIEHASTNDCFVPPGLASDMAGARLRILPLPAENSPSGH